MKGMTNKDLYQAFGGIDPKMIEVAAPAEKVQKNKSNIRMRWGAVAACFAVVVASMMVMMPMLFEGDSPMPPVDVDTSSGGYTVGETTDAENALEKYYDYVIDDGVFASYICGKVIDADKIGDKLDSVTVTGGWKNRVGEWMSTETLNAEVYAIEYIESNVAVALKFIDKGEALTTTHYYVIMNPDADLTAVEEYIITPIVPNDPEDEITGEVNE